LNARTPETIQETLMPFPLRATLGLAAALLAGPALAQASSSSVFITSFGVSTSGGTLAWSDPYQSFSTSALEAGGLLGADSDSYEVGDWGFAIAGANTPHAIAAVSTTTPQTFWASADASSSFGPATNLPNEAETRALQSGAFSLSGAGSVTFSIGYELAVSAPGGNALTDYGSALLNFELADTDGSSGGSLADALNSFALASGVGSRSGSFTLTLDLAAGELGFYNLQGSALAFATASAVPEPESWLLLACGMAGMAAWVRTRRLPNAH
jgi:hypothetical protein